MIADFQNAFVRIIADKTFREQFFENGPEALRDYLLTSKEEAALLGISRSEMDRYATSILSKRTEEFTRAIPITIRVSPRLPLRYKRWVEHNPAQGKNIVLDPGLSEALRALSILRSALIADPSEAEYTPDLLAFEVLRSCSFQDRQVRFMKSNYQIDRIATEIHKGVIPIDPDSCPVDYRFDNAGIRWKRRQ